MKKKIERKKKKKKKKNMENERELIDNIEQTSITTATYRFSERFSHYELNSVLLFACISKIFLVGSSEKQEKIMIALRS